MNRKITLSIAEDHEVIRKALVKLLDEFEEFQVTVDAGNGQELLMRLSEATLPDVLLLDVDMPVMDGIETLQRLREEYDDQLVILALSMHTEFYLVQCLLESGANGFISKQVSPKELKQAIIKACETKFYLSPGMSKQMFGNKYLRRNIEHELNKMEVEIVRLICDQKNNKEIGKELNLSPNTINSYRTKILAKVGAVNTAGLVIYAVRSGLYRVDRDFGF